MQMQRLTWRSVKDVIRKNLNFCSTDDRARDYVNRACERLMNEGQWVGTVARYRVCVTNGCIVWPRQLDAILSFAVCNTPMPIHSPWHEFLGNGTYLQDDCNGCGASALIDRDEVASFDNVIGSNKRLAVYCDVAEDPATYITLQYYNTSAQFVRTAPSGSWIDGERVSFNTAGAYSYTLSNVMANGFVRAIKPVTNGTVRLYEHDTVADTYRPLAYYEPDETIPVYRRSFIPGLNISTTEDCTKRSVTVMAKKRFIPVINDDDFLAISHAEAIRMAVQSIWKSENNQAAEASIYMNGGIDPLTRNRIEGAIPLLNAQLRAYRGSGAVIPIKMVNASTFGAGGIPTLI